MAKRTAPPRARRLLAALVRALAALVVVWLGGFAWFVLAQPGPAPLSARTDAVVVLTGGPGRIARGIEVLAKGSAQRMFVSGVNPKVTEAEFKDASNLSSALLACCVELGQAAETTRGNALEVAEFVRRRNLASIRLVTAGFHMRRARAEVAAVLPAGVALVPDAVPSDRSARGLMVEYHKLMAARALLLTGIAR